MKNYKLIIAALMLICLGCTSTLSENKLYGKWKYTRVEKPESPSDSVSTMVLQEQTPYIEFGKTNTVKIVWNNEVLSHGTFALSGKDINITEQLPDGKTRKFPFFVSVLTDNKIVFETLGAEGSRVTAIKL